VWNPDCLARYSAAGGAVDRGCDGRGDARGRRAVWSAGTITWKSSAGRGYPDQPLPPSHGRSRTARNSVCTALRCAATCANRCWPRQVLSPGSARGARPGAGWGPTGGKAGGSRAGGDRGGQEAHERLVQHGGRAGARLRRAQAVQGGECGDGGGGGAWRALLHPQRREQRGEEPPRAQQRERPDTLQGCGGQRAAIRARERELVQSARDVRLRLRAAPVSVPAPLHNASCPAFS